MTVQIFIIAAFIIPYIVLLINVCRKEEISLGYFVIASLMGSIGSIISFLGFFEN